MAGTHNATDNFAMKNWLTEDAQNFQNWNAEFAKPGHLISFFVEFQYPYSDHSNNIYCTIMKMKLRIQM
jgi:hypothetical protein